MIKYLIYHGCSTKDEYCACKTEINGESIQEIIGKIDIIEKKNPVYRIEKLMAKNK